MHYQPQNEIMFPDLARNVCAHQTALQQTLINTLPHNKQFTILFINRQPTLIACPWPLFPKHPEQKFSLDALPTSPTPIHSPPLSTYLSDVILAPHPEGEVSVQCNVELTTRTQVHDVLVVDACQHLGHTLSTNHNTHIQKFCAMFWSSNSYTTI